MKFNFKFQYQMFDYRALYEIQLQVSVDFLRVVQLIPLVTYFTNAPVRLLIANIRSFYK